ncbi:MAG: DUF255 domain-containing protein [Phycisphaeraceae bacterium]|nr:DUF255 domain-containing protein [Phycisphaeraceae bacterium]MCW5755479.1 DUF255 domain-containing protein [Phycisphaeraceae bacterium]
MPADSTSGNTLGSESSPYLLQHAHNPVHWRPWGHAAFAEARERNLPIFLSIGYATCYWCHVMERESFEDPGTAAVMNANFVCVKVDREERPEVDDLAMAATIIMRGQGGWPLSLFLEPEHLRPFWCGTYFPSEPRHGMPSFTQVLESIAAAWATQREQVLTQAEALADAVREHLAPAQSTAPVGPSHIEQAVETLLRMYDPTHGGFGSAPKFPQPCLLDFLIDVRTAATDAPTQTALDRAITHTLERMSIGGLWDHIGGGFHRYCVDATWTIPHFEKMLYDNALLARVFARATLAAQDDAPASGAAIRPLAGPQNAAWFTLIVRRIIEYTRREMTHPSGGFFSAQDAEVDGREGKNYLWTAEDFRQALPHADAELALTLYGVEKGPNFRDPHHPDEPAAGVLRLADLPTRLYAPDVVARMPAIEATLLAARDRRPKPRTDDKILASWNGLMIGACATAARLDPSHAWMLDLAERAATFVLNTLRVPAAAGRTAMLHRSWREGRLGPPAVLEDYAFLIEGLLSLVRANRADTTRKPRPDVLSAAIELVQTAEEHLGDGSGGFFDTPDARSDLFVRPRSTHDGALPCGSSAMLHAYLDLHELTEDPAWLDRARMCLASLSQAIAASPVSAINATRGLLRLLRAKAIAAHPAPDLPTRDPGFTPVEIDASVDHITIGPDTPCSLRIRVRIAPGYHLVAADPGPAFDAPGAPALVPFRVGVAHGTGLAAYADYPPGTPWGQDQMLVYEGEVEMMIAVERTGEWTGTPVLVVSFQACTEHDCLVPMRLELNVGVQRV